MDNEKRLSDEQVVSLVGCLATSAGRVAMCQAILSRPDRKDALVRTKDFIKRAYIIKNVDPDIADQCTNILYETLVIELQASLDLKCADALKPLL